MLTLDVSYSSAASLTATTDSESFLFTLVNPSGNDPIKITRKADNSGGIRSHENMGPSFGNKTFYDFQVWSSGSATGQLDLGYGFTCPDNVDKTTYFTGKSPFTITELEVFEVDI